MDLCPESRGMGALEPNAYPPAPRPNYHDTSDAVKDNAAEKNYEKSCKSNEIRKSTQTRREVVVNLHSALKERRYAYETSCAQEGDENIHPDNNPKVDWRRRLRDQFIKIQKPASGTEPRENAVEPPPLKLHRSKMMVPITAHVWHAGNPFLEAFLPHCMVTTPQANWAAFLGGVVGFLADEALLAWFNIWYQLISVTRLRCKKDFAGGRHSRLKG
ncbi:hypothetical protein CC86DRAFT_373939 [Ophiobolus disseminans]|uniref:Uncharacterized protein n=1 Tax=Ophiobolus disseminans TaxID=1469910 RepID=A0A6A6ZLD7_9PLEO|nr:hypothetical protein CC86DRAFT_373939 [Ophiobolus disseminans]